MWNSLPDAVVNSSTINQFKNRLQGGPKKSAHQTHGNNFVNS